MAGFDDTVLAPGPADTLMPTDGVYPKQHHRGGWLRRKHKGKGRTAMFFGPVVLFSPQMMPTLLTLDC